MNAGPAPIRAADGAAMDQLGRDARKVREQVGAGSCRAEHVVDLDGAQGMQTKPLLLP